MAIQMGVTIIIGAYIGKRLDTYYATERPYFTLALALFAVFAAMYLTIKDLLKEN